MKLPIVLLTVGGLGLLRPAPGTWGSLPPVALALAMASLAVPGWMTTVTIALMGLAFAIACVRFGTYGEQHFGKKDASPIVADEVAGQAIALLFLPWRAPVDRAAWVWNILIALGAFGAFRMFDILKPPPADRLQRLPAGWGVLVDDLVAGVYALLLVQIILLFL